jgi:hypothetical protein
MHMRETVPIDHTHACEHDCQCLEWTHQLCDRCELAEVVRRRHHLGDMPTGEILAKLFLAMAQSIRPGVVGLVVVAPEEIGDPDQEGRNAIN